MAKDDPLAGLALDDDELELIRRLRKEKREETERTVHVRTAAGDEADVPFGVAKKWLAKVGILIDDDAEAEPEPEPEPEPKEKPVKAFGRRVG